jgi:hypothetical protein
MNKADGQDTADRLSAIVANSLDSQAKTRDLSRIPMTIRVENRDTELMHALHSEICLRQPSPSPYRLLQGHCGFAVLLLFSSSQSQSPSPYSSGTPLRVL